MAPPRKGRKSTPQAKPSVPTNKRKAESGTSIPAKRTRTSNSKAQIVSSITPRKSQRDPNEYRVIQLSTGLTVALISRKSPSRDRASSSTSTYFQSPYSIVWPFPNASEQECHFIEPVPFSLGCTTATNFPPNTIGGPSAIAHGDTPKEHSYTSVALVVNVGGLDDSPSRQGLAHFTEHMVHYGSKKFPNEDAINVVVANFGIYNATTKQHTTNYYNRVPDLVLDKNLAMFAEMLTEPLFKLEVLNREVNAVDNEFYLRLPHWRKLLLMSHVCIQGKVHPLKRFMCGSLETLGEGTEGKQVQREMKDYHQKNYVAPAMTLSINSTKSLDELQELTLRHFSNFLPGNRSIFAKTLDKKTPPLVLQGNQHVILQGLSCWSELSIVWFLPASLSIDDLQERVMPLIVHILSDTSDKSLDYYLRSEQLIWSMYSRFSSTRYATLLEIDFMTTEKGSQNVNQIVKATFNFIRVLRNATEQEMKRAFEEMRARNLNAYHCGNQKCTLETTKDFAMRLQYIDEPVNVVSSESWMDSQFNFRAVQGALKLLESEETTLIETLSRKDKDKLVKMGNVKTAPYTNTKFVVKPWNKILPSSRNGSGDGATNFAFIPKNRYLALDLLSSKSPSAMMMRCPNNCGDIQIQKLTWSRRENSSADYFIPKIIGMHHGHTTLSHDPFYSAIRIKFISSASRIFTRRNCALSFLHGFVVLQNVASLWSEFINAGFTVSILPGHPLTLSIGSSSSQLELAMTQLVSCVFEKPTTSTVFSLAKQQLNASLENYLNNNDLISETLLNCSIFENANLSLDCLGVLEELTLHDLNTYVKAFRQSAFATLELFGNVPVQSFSFVAAHLEKMPFAPLVDNDARLYSDSSLSYKSDFYVPGEKCVRVKTLNSSTYTTSVTNYYILGPDGADLWRDELFSAAIFFMKCRAFMDLRTEQQLGYSVYVRKYIPQGVKLHMKMFSVTVTATARKFTACELDQKIDQFLAEYGEYVRNMSAELFKTMLELTENKFIKEEEQDDVANWFESRFKADFGKLDVKWKCLRARIKKLSIQVLSGNEEAQTKACTCQICSSIAGWKSGQASGSGSQFQFAVGKGATEKYFISSFN